MEKDNVKENKRPKEIVPDEKLPAKVDPVKEKQQKNINQLKDNLAQQLWNHKQLEMKEMPYDSSKVKFHDKLDMFFRMKSV